MENQEKRSSEDNQTADQGFDTRNQYSGSGDFSPDEQEGPNKEREEDLESSESGNDIDTNFPDELKQGDSGHSKSDIDPKYNGK